MTDAAPAALAMNQHAELGHDQDEIEISVVVPVYNEEDNVVSLWNEIRDALAPWGDRVEAIFVDDGSRDRSIERLRPIAESDPRVVLVRLARNYGQTAAMAAGFERARGRLIVPLDGDRQNDPAEIPHMVRLISESVDVVCGWRKNRHDAWLRSFVSRQANRLIGRVTGVELHDYGCTLKVFKAPFIKPVRLYGELHRFLPVFAHWEGARIAELAVNHRPRVAGTSKYGLDRTFRVVLDLLLVQFITKYRGRPMRFFMRWIWGSAVAGLLCAGIGLAGWIGAGWAGARWLTAGLILAVGSVQLLAVALVAELLWRTYYESRDARPYRIGAIIRAGQPDRESAQSDPLQSASSGRRA